MAQLTTEQKAELSVELQRMMFFPSEKRITIIQ